MPVPVLARGAYLLTKEPLMADKQRRPPYASGADLDRLFDRMQSLAEPKNIDTKWVKGYQLASAQPEALVSVLRWLGVIDQEGNSLGVWNELRSGKSEPLARLVKESYSDIFSSVDVETADRKDLEGAFIAAYKTGNTGRVIKCFLALCGKADIPAAAAQKGSTGAEPVTPRPNRATAKKVAGHKGAKATGTAGTRTAGDSLVTISLNVEIPADWDAEAVRKRIALVQEAIHAA
jgi:hypothetical protein